MKYKILNVNNIIVYTSVVNSHHLNNYKCVYLYYLSVIYLYIAITHNDHETMHYVK